MHHTEIAADGFKSLQEGEVVEFELQRDERVKKLNEFSES